MYPLIFSLGESPIPTDFLQNLFECKGGNDDYQKLWGAMMSLWNHLHAPVDFPFQSQMTLAEIRVLDDVV